MTTRDKFWCPSCGAEYEAEVRNVITRENGSADCFACHEVMATWNSFARPSFALITAATAQGGRREDAGEVSVNKV